jgi:hypothetical protein
MISRIHREVEPFSGKTWRPTADVCAPASLLFEIAVGRAAIPPIGAAGALPIPAGVPVFVPRMIEDGRSPESQHRLSFLDIIERLKRNRFAIVAGVDLEEVSAFVARAESAVRSLRINTVAANPRIPHSMKKKSEREETMRQGTAPTQKRKVRKMADIGRMRRQAAAAQILHAYIEGSLIVRPAMLIR